jgi:tetratricopeptide (TPR) repeat protein
VMFELLSGQAPFPKGKRLSDDYLDQLLRDRRDLRPDLSRLNPAVPAGVVDIIRKLLAFDPKERYQTARDLKDDLERELSNRQLKYARESSPRARLAKFRRRYPALTTALAALIFLILPATAVTGVKYRSYQRLKERQTAEALVKFDDSLRTCYEVQTLTHSRNHDARLFDRGVGKAEELVRGYGIDAADAWDASPDITRLDVSRRQQLFDNLGNAFFVISEATAQQARDSGDSELTGCAERWKKLADDCFGKAGRSPELGKNLRPSPSDFAKLDETELLDLANGLMNDGRYRQATFALRELTDRNPKHFMAWFNLAHSLDNLGAFADSVHAWRTCTALEPDFAVCHYNLGMTWLSANQPGLAERSFGQALRCDEQLVNALAYRAVCRSRQENLDGAEADLTEALSREPDKTSYRLLRAQVRQKLGKMREAAEDEAAGLGREPDDEFGYAMRGYYRMFPTSADLVTRPEKVVADLKSALADFDHAIAINSRNQATLRNKAVALEQLNRIDDAVAVYGSVLKYYPDLLSARATRGVLLARLGRVREAVAEAKLCESAVPTPFMEYQLGSLYAAASAHDTRYKADANRLLASSLRHGLERPELFRTDADLAPLRADERFQRLVGLAEVMVTTRSQLARP